MSNLKQIGKDLNYLYSRINWAASNIDAEGVRILNELGGDIKKAVEQKTESIKELRSYYLKKLEIAVKEDNNNDIVLLDQFVDNLTKILNNEPIK